MYVFSKQPFAEHCARKANDNLHDNEDHDSDDGILCILYISLRAFAHAQKITHICIKYTNNEYTYEYTYLYKVYKQYESIKRLQALLIGN